MHKKVTMLRRLVLLRLPTRLGTTGMAKLNRKLTKGGSLIKKFPQGLKRDRISISNSRKFIKRPGISGPKIIRLIHQLK